MALRVLLPESGRKREAESVTHKSRTERTGSQVMAAQVILTLQLSGLDFQTRDSGL